MTDDLPDASVLPPAQRRATPENRLLLDGATAWRSLDARRERIQRVLAPSPEIDWARLLRLAASNRVSALLYWNLNAIAPSQVPAPILEQLRQQNRSNALWSLRLKAELLRILRVFADREIPVLPLKGPVLAALYYPDPTLRECADLDILVRREQLRAAEDALSSIGYTPLDHDRDRQLKLNYHLRFEHAVNHVHVELHWQIRRTQHSSFVDGDFLWEDAETTLWENTRILIPRTENNLIFLCIHAFRHQWKRLQWIHDIPQLIAARPEIDWRWTVAQARRLHSYRILIASLRLADDLYGLTLPDALRALLSTTRLSEREMRQIADNLFLETQRGVLLQQIFFFDNLADVRRYLWVVGQSIRLTPNECDTQWLALPRPLHFLYYLIRPIRLVKEHAPTILIKISRWLGSLRRN